MALSNYVNNNVIINTEIVQTPIINSMSYNLILKCIKYVK